MVTRELRLVEPGRLKLKPECLRATLPRRMAELKIIATTASRTITGRSEGCYSTFRAKTSTSSIRGFGIRFGHPTDLMVPTDLGDPLWDMGRPLSGDGNA